MFKKTLLKAVDYSRLKLFEKNEIERYKKEIYKVREIQATFLPEFKNTENFDITFSMLPAEDLSGDFLDGVKHSQNNTRLIVCDVAGHGIATSYIGNEIRSLFRIFQKDLLPPSDIIQSVNNDMTSNLTNNYYLATAAVCDINTTTGVVNYSSAGHPPSLLYHAEEGKFTWIKTKGTMLGVFSDAEYKTIEFTMQSGDILLMYSDGITEAWSGDKSVMFGEERLVNAIINADKSSSNHIIMDVLNSLYEFTDYSTQEDDITIICIKKL
jgi:sigma-B regulation protein RsbU (phosphoserine phosphatase)